MLNLFNHIMLLNIYIYLIINILNKTSAYPRQLSYTQGDRFQKLIQILCRKEVDKMRMAQNKKGPPDGGPFPILVG